VARLWVLLCGLLMAVPAGAVETVSVRADAWFPVNGEPDSARPGFAIEVLERVFVAPAYTLDYQLLDWQRALELASAATVDCVVGAYRSEAPGLLFPAYPLALDRNAFFVLAGSDWRYDGVASIGPRSVAVIGEYDYGGELDAWIARRPANLHVAHGREPLRRNLRMLLAGRVDALVESEMVMQATLAALDLEGKVVEAGAVGPASPFYFACSNTARGAAIIGQFEQGWRRLRESGELARLYGRYGVTPP